MAPDKARHMPQWEVGLQTVWLNSAKRCDKKVKRDIAEQNECCELSHLSLCLHWNCRFQFDHSGKNYHQGAIVKGSLTAYVRKLEKQKYKQKWAHGPRLEKATTLNTTEVRDGTTHHRQLQIMVIITVQDELAAWRLILDCISLFHFWEAFSRSCLCYRNAFEVLSSPKHQAHFADLFTFGN